MRPGTHNESNSSAGSHISYLDAGTGGRPVLLIHGNFAGKLWWRELISNPPRNSRLIAPDLPGFGASPGGRGFAPSMRRYVASLETLVDALEVDPILVGHSFGAAVAVALALANPQRFPAMLLLSPAPLTGLDTPLYLYPYLESYRHDRQGLRQALLNVMETRVPPYLEDLVDEARAMHPTGFTGNARLLSEWSINRGTRRYTNPVLVASGYRDSLISPSSARATARAFPAGWYANLGEVGHSPQIEAPHLVRHLIARLIESITYSE